MAACIGAGKTGKLHEMLRATALALYRRVYVPTLLRLLPLQRETTLSLIYHIAKVRSAEYALAHIEHAVLFDTGRSGEYGHRGLLRFALRRARQSKEEGAFLEFGVYRGATLSLISEIASPLDVYGFDSFEGLPEDWAGYTLARGHFSTGGDLPRVRENVRLYKGLFAKTIPQYLAERTPSRISFLHIDCDLYSSTCDVFRSLGSLIKSGAIIVFDEYYGYPGWELNGEFKAFQEWIMQSANTYRYIGFSFGAVAVEIL